MTYKDFSTIQRMLGMILGVALGIGADVEGALFDAVETIDAALDREIMTEDEKRTKNRKRSAGTICALSLSRISTSGWTASLPGGALSAGASGRTADRYGRTRHDLQRSKTNPAPIHYAESSC